MKKWIHVLLAVMMMVSLSACGSGESSKESVATQVGTVTESVNSQNEDSDSSILENEESVENNAKEEMSVDSEDDSSSVNPTIAMGDSLEDWTISIDGIVYQLPCDMEVFLNDGWLPTGFETLEDALAYEKTIEADDRCNPVLYKEDLDMTMYMIQENLTGSTVNWLDGTVVGIWLQDGSELEVTIPGGLVLNNDLTMDELISVLGEPDDKTDTTCTYYASGSYSFDFNYCDMGTLHWRIEKGGY